MPLSSSKVIQAQHKTETKLRFLEPGTILPIGRIKSVVQRLGRFLRPVMPDSETAKALLEQPRQTGGSLKASKNGKKDPGGPSPLLELYRVENLLLYPFWSCAKGSFAAPRTGIELNHFGEDPNQTLCLHLDHLATH